MRRPPARRRIQHRWWLVAAAGLVVCGLSALALMPVPPDAPAAGSPAASSPAARSPAAGSPDRPGAGGATSSVGATATPTPPPDVAYPEVGSRSYTIAPGDGPVIGHSGDLYRFQVAVETDIANLDVAAFAALVEQTYGDPQGWTVGGRWRFQRVGPGQPADFVLYLVTPATRDVLCQDGYDRYTSCRKNSKVVLNVARWVHGIPQYGASQFAYQQYMINHETGHRIGFGHELCPGAGRPAPVMQQQTLGLHGCTANSWPYPGGVAYHGASGNY
jgi:hypothetical protein